MSDSASSAWNSGPYSGPQSGPHGGPWGASAHHRCGGRPPRRALEIIGIIVAFVWFWPLALAYLVWKLMGYPKFDEAKAFLRENFGRPMDDLFAYRRPAGGFSNGGFGTGTGNAAFEEYRRKELQRLEEERRRLDEEARAFTEFVEELKRAKDREEFDAFMAKRRTEKNGPVDI
ncbi:DUF2852 domain-containing protein [Microvirga terricola]|uniref:DUF2852 domain-containing protein n=1 Tax=Microvirga terricola TaxID=2719797 RepID=A0ABX0VAE8_9HYPH|nr:DUF2852 domain-containing protein [Microvirga terricola]NIX75980.1 DUF2852 domain-containing protein [Microvirga terricola]